MEKHKEVRMIMSIDSQRLQSLKNVEDERKTIMKHSCSIIIVLTYNKSLSMSSF
jgi:hypothetical protein